MLTVYSKLECVQCENLTKELDRIGKKYKKVYLTSLKELESLFDDNDVFYTSFPVIYDEDANLIGDYSIAMSKFEEPLLKPNEHRFSMYPITYPDIYNMYKKARASYWQPEEITLKDDMISWNKMTDDEKHFVSYILAFFAASDGIVNENIDTNFSEEIQIPEARAFYTFQMAIESVHSETYSILLDKYVQNSLEKQKLQRGISTIPSVKQKADWAMEFMSKGRPFAERLFAFACVEGIYFSGSFCAIYWLRTKNILPGLTFSNELISRDEGLHTDFALLIFSKLNNRLTEERAHEIVKSAVENESFFITEAIPCRLIGMNADLMTTYIEFVADRLLQQAGYSKIFNVKNPFLFMEHISLEGKTNFFEKRVGEYAKAGVMNEGNDDFDLEEDF